MSTPLLVIVGVVVLANVGLAALRSSGPRITTIERRRDDSDGERKDVQ